ncbi:MAG TPA: hypothetical protein VNN80_00215, partial [Polyangiaceae bacterium]|nr:hypothetical protein [Polyangiaceae bacterium]
MKTASAIGNRRGNARREIDVGNSASGVATTIRHFGGQGHCVTAMDPLLVTQQLVSPPSNAGAALS